ncbi:MAG: enoyl-CoA hydratase/isomerase family protein [Thermodesulfobacteriota bacterium]
MYEYLLFEVDEHKIGTLTINKERALNTLSLETITELKQFTDNELISSGLKVLIVTGAGRKAFVAGADIGQMREMTKKEFENYCNIGHSAFNALQKAPFPVIAAINGYALGGGCELSVACDIRIASENAKIGFPETKLGLFPCWGGSQRVTRLMGIGKAKELIFTGEMISAEEALQIGLVDKVVKQEILIEETSKIARQIAGNSPLAVGYAKNVINTGSEMDLPEALSYELENGLNCFDSEDRKEGMSAFLEKRTANFKGN